MKDRIKELLKNRMFIIGVCSATVLIIVLIVAIVINVNSKNKNNDSSNNSSEKEPETFEGDFAYENIDITEDMVKEIIEKDEEIEKKARDVYRYSRRMENELKKDNPDQEHLNEYYRERKAAYGELQKLIEEQINNK